MNDIYTTSQNSLL